jgi:hypothetical protein
MLKKLVIIIACIIVFLSCGVGEYYYLPQVPEGVIVTVMNTNATINFPPIPDEYYYAAGYSIFYRIYTSNYSASSAPSRDELSKINSSLLSDYNYFLTISNPANTSSTTSVNTFKDRKFFELDFDGIDNNFDMLPKTGGTLWINFPTKIGDFPIASLDGGVENRLLRSGQLTSPKPTDRYFSNTAELRSTANAIPNINADVAAASGTNDYTYVAMYIVAVGTNLSNFSTLYSKPTFINVFKLPDLN